MNDAQRRQRINSQKNRNAPDSEKIQSTGRSGDRRSENAARQRKNQSAAAAAKEEREAAKREQQTKFELGSIVGPSTNAGTSSTSVLRYPSEGRLDSDSDYVLFDFYTYAPPFRKQRGDRNFTPTPVVTTPRSNLSSRQQFRRSSGVAGTERTNLAATAGNYFDYNQSKDYQSAGEDYPSIIMYMPEDISTGFKSNWGGKAFSNIGANILKSAGAEGLSKIDALATGAVNTYDKVLPLTGAAVIRKGIQKITGDVVTNDDIFGGISGAILNPNTELLFNSSDMRNFQLNFKLVPRNFTEADIINKICKTFKMCTLPSRNPGEVFGASNQGITAGFIGVPNLCKVNFMSGNDEHKVLPRYKMCAITQVDVNYTPDGAYATYNDANSQPVAIELSINFQETKLVFAEEIRDDSIR
jgi:hypothetical protein